MGLGDKAAIAKVVSVLKKRRGVAALAAVDLGIHERTLYQWADKSAEIATQMRARWMPPSEKETARIVAVFAENDGKLTNTATALGVSPRTLYRLIERVPAIAKAAGKPVSATRTPKPKAKASKPKAAA